MLHRPVAFDADDDPTFDAPQALDDDEERQLDDATKLWFKERVAGRDKDEQILKRGGGSGEAIERHATNQMEEDKSTNMRRRTL